MEVSGIEFSDTRFPDDRDLSATRLRIRSIPRGRRNRLDAWRPGKTEVFVVEREIGAVGGIAEQNMAPAPSYKDGFLCEPGLLFGRIFISARGGLVMIELGV